MFRDTCQRAAACRALGRLAGFEGAFAEDGPTPELSRFLDDAGALGAKQRVMLEVALAAWKGESLARVRGFGCLETTFLNCASLLHEALSMGPAAVDVWLERVDSVVVGSWSLGRYGVEVLAFEPGLFGALVHGCEEAEGGVPVALPLPRVSSLEALEGELLEFAQRLAGRSSWRDERFVFGLACDAALREARRTVAEGGVPAVDRSLRARQFPFRRALPGLEVPALICRACGKPADASSSTGIWRQRDARSDCPECGGKPFDVRLDCAGCGAGWHTACCNLSTAEHESAAASWSLRAMP